MIVAMLLFGWWLALTPALASTQEPGSRVEQTASAEVIAAIQVHGNNATPDAEILTTAGLVVGALFTPAVLTDTRTRLLATRRFEDVTVLKRYASIVDASRISVVILVNERPVRIELPGVPGELPRVSRRGPVRNLMFMPVLDGEDGYGLTYGARLAYVDVPNKGSRFAFPLTWGGTKRAGAEFDQAVKSGPIDRVQGGIEVERRRNPAFDADDDRKRIWARIERAAGPVRLGGEVASAHVSFLGEDDHLASASVDATFDTRLDPAMPRNAVYARAAWTRFHVDGRRVDRRSFDARGYLGLVGQTILVGRVTGQAGRDVLPPYLQPLLGGWSSLRGFKAGAFVGDTVATASSELRVPLSSPLHVARLGISVFADAGVAAAHGQRLGGQPVHIGLGAGAWVTATVFRLGVSVAHGRHADTRVNFGLGVTF
ncbi:MAG: BamA/TamA family outer membrane protein [Acidobacteriota bacterium]